jgi:tRNA-splicing ligase RtcB
MVRELVEEAPYRWRIKPPAGMRVPGVIFASRDLLPDLAADRSVAR